MQSFDDLMHLFLPKPPSEHMGATVDAVDQFPGIDDEGDFVTIDPDRPALPDETPSVPALLAAILDAVKKPEPNPVAWHPNYYNVPTAAGERTFETPSPVRHIYVSNAPGNTRVFIGGTYMGAMTVGKSMRISAPYPVHSVRVDWDTATVGNTFGVIFSSEPFDVEII